MGELEAIRVFLAVAQAHSFTGAARQLGVTPAQITRAVAGLEDRLGVQLFVRTTRRVSLTSAGAAYAAKVEPLVAELSQAAEATRSHQDVATGRIRLSAPMSFGQRVLPDVIAQFRVLYPDVHLSVDLTDAFVDIVQGDYDLAIRISGPPDDKSTIWRKIVTIPRDLVAAPAYLARAGTPDAPEDLNSHTLLGFSTDGHDETWLLSQGTRTRRARAGRTVSVNNGDLLAGLAVRGEGIALLPRYIVSDHLASGALVPVMADWRAPEIWLTLFYPPYEHLPARVAVFSDFFERYVSEILED